MKPSNLLIIITIFVLSFSFSSCKKSSIPDSRCSLVPDSGSCLAYFPKYYYDSEAQACKTFIWGGCNGTIPFETLEECEQCLCQ